MPPEYLQEASSTEENIEGERQLRRRIKLESHLTSGCGFGRAKQRLIDSFWGTVWPALEAIGWTKVEGQGRQKGSLVFVPTGVKIDDPSSQKGKDYYDRIRDVIDRVCSNRNAGNEEASVAAIFLQDMENLEELEGIEFPIEHCSSRIGFSEQAPEIDLSWKEGGTSFPKKSSRVGVDFQATKIPERRERHLLEKSDALYDQVWDPSRAVEGGVNSLIHETITYNKKEIAMATLHSLNYVPNEFTNAIRDAKVVDGSDWTEEEKETFRKEMFRLRKDLVAVSKSMGKSIDSCYTFYLGNFKKSDDYRPLKSVCEDEKAEKQAASDHGLDACAICGDGGSLLICDGCEGEYHMGCLRPPLANVPEGYWECDDCVNSKFLEARDALIKTSQLYERVGNHKKRGADEEQESSNPPKRPKTEANNDIILRPSPKALQAVRSLAACINKALR